VALRSSRAGTRNASRQAPQAREDKLTTKSGCQSWLDHQLLWSDAALRPFARDAVEEQARVQKRTRPVDKGIRRSCVLGTLQVRHCCTRFKMPSAGMFTACFAMAAAGSEWRLLLPPARWKVWRGVVRENDFRSGKRSGATKRCRCCNLAETCWAPRACGMLHRSLPHTRH